MQNNSNLKQCTLHVTSVTSGIFPIKHANIIESMEGKELDKCDVKLVFTLDQNDFVSTGRCRCTGRSRPRCNSCQNSGSWRTKSEAHSIMRDIEQRGQRRFQEMLNDIKKFFLACKDFTNFLSSSILLINLQNRYLQGRKKSNTLSFDLESTFEKYVRKYQWNSLSQSGKRCELGDDISGIYRHVRMPTSFENIFPDFADISIRGKLLALSMSMKMLFRLVSLHHLHKNRRGQMHLMREIAQYICRMFFRKQMRKCK